MSADITFQHKQYQRQVSRWAKVSDVCAGSDAVKAAAEKYLPKLNPQDSSPENDKRYEQYIARAVFYNVTGRTLQGLIGAAFRNPPAVNAPALDYVLEDIDGGGVSIHQQAQSCLDGVMRCGRHILLVDYPRTNGATSIAEAQAGNIRAITVERDASSVTYWRTERIGSRNVLVEIRIKEIECEIDGFGEREIPQYRRLQWSPGSGYTAEIYRQNDKKEWVLFDGPIEILDGSGSRWDEIPLVIVGSINNDPEVDPIPLYDLAEINLAHYRNSADHEDSVFFTGQCQPVITGIDEDWYKFMRRENMYIGARHPIALPAGADYKIEQPGPNSMTREAMQDKEAQMVALGARLVERGGAVKTATEAQGEIEAEHSVLSLACENVSAAYRKCLAWMARFNRTSDSGIDYRISTDFVGQQFDADILSALVAGWQAQAYPQSVLIDQLRKRGIIPQDMSNEQIRELIEADGGAGSGRLPFGEGI